jgi:hypothetical protein
VANEEFMKLLEAANIPYTNDRGTIWTDKQNHIEVQNIQSEMAWEGLTQEQRRKVELMLEKPKNR